MKIYNWLTACLRKIKAIFVSKGADSKFKVKSTKKSEAPKKGQFNIMLSYGSEASKNSFNDDGKIRKDIRSSKYELGNKSPQELMSQSPELYQLIFFAP